jgi:hypothetical protein
MVSTGCGLRHLNGPRDKRWSTLPFPDLDDHVWPASSVHEPVFPCRYPPQAAQDEVLASASRHLKAWMRTHLSQVTFHWIVSRDWPRLSALQILHSDFWPLRIVANGRCHEQYSDAPRTHDTSLNSGQSGVFPGAPTPKEHRCS